MEWPPHPARLFYALVSALHTFGTEGEGATDAAERKALEWLEELDNPKIFCLKNNEINARRIVSHYVPVNDPDLPEKVDPAKHKPAHLPEFREKKERTFPTVTLPHDKNAVFFQWDDVSDDNYRRGLEGLFQRVSYLGHSSSLIALSFADKVPDNELTCWHTKGGEREGQVFRGISKGLLRLLETSYQPNELSQQNYRLPSYQVRYSTANGEKSESPDPRSHFGSKWVVYRFPEWARVPVAASHSLTTNLKTEACRLAEKSGSEILPEAMAMVSGHKIAGGAPFEGPHVAWVALPHVGHRNASGQVFGLAAILPRSLEDPKHRALAESIHSVLHQIRSLPYRGSTIKLERVTQKTISAATFPKCLTSERWCSSSSVWATVTPMALDRFPGFLFGRARKTEGEVATTEKALEEAKASIRQSCINIGLPEPRDVSIAKVSWVEPCPPIHQFAAVKKASSKPRPVHAHVKLIFEQAVTGPILLGRLRYLGMGLFVPLGSNGKGGAQ